MSRFPLTFAFALATALVGHAVRAEEPNSAAPPKPAPSVAPQSPVERALEKQVSIKLKDTPLKEAAAYLADISGVNVLLDSKALANDGIPEDRRMTFELPNVPFGAALEMMLRDQELSYAILDGQVLLITTPQAAKEHVITHVYAAGDLVTLHDRSNELKHADVDMDSLIDLVTTSCHPTSWSTQGGNGAITYVSGGLVVSNRSDVQQEVRGLLDDLRRIRNEDNKDRLPTVLLIGDTPADAEVRRRLDRREDIALENASLEELRSFLKSRGLQTILDQKAINDAGFTADAKFSLKLHDVPLGFDLRTLLAQHELACYGEAGLLMITSQAAEKDHVQVGVYPVRDLVSEQPDDTADNFDFDSLIDAITSTVSPTAWGDNGGPGAIGPFSNPPVLVINQSQEIHHQISDLLERLRAQKAASAKTAAKSPHPGESPSVIRVHRVAGADDAALDQFISVIRALIEPKTWDHGDVYIA
ncbi:MAG TPA: hypothetical protein VKB78_13035, partial [Pirellulales bacterium]|nr:hypothetical protein [Pirellulales bacterium]